LSRDVPEFRDKTVLVTGASSGIGAELARRFAADGAKLILVARRADRLAELADELRIGGFASQTAVIVADLVEPGACERVIGDARLASDRIDVLINNAGIGEYGDFAEQDFASVDRMMRLNMTALVHLTRQVLPEMLARSSGWIMNVASTAAFQPTPYMGVYGATKAFVLSFSMSLREEVRRRGLVVTCVCPGPVKTEFFSRGGYEHRRMRDYSRIMVQADWLAEQAYRSLVRQKPFCTPGIINWLSARLARCAPLSLVSRGAARLLRPIDEAT